MNALRQKTMEWLRQGTSPRRLALTLALGFAVGCIPMVGLPTALCLVLALALRLNLPAIQAANYAVMPLQVLLMAPFVRLGQRLFPDVGALHFGAAALPHIAPISLAWRVAGFAGQALAAWLLVAVPAVLLLTGALTLLLRRIPAMAPAAE